VIDLIGTIRHIYQRVNQIFALVNAILTLQETGGTITTDGAQQDIYRVETPMGVFAPMKVLIDFSNQTVAETVVIRTYYRINAGGGLVQKDELTYIGVVNPPLVNIELEPNRFGIRVSMQRTVGGAFAYDWEAIFKG